MGGPGGGCLVWYETGRRRVPCKIFNAGLAGILHKSQSTRVCRGAVSNAFITSNRKCLQAGEDICTIQQSVCNLYARRVWLWRVPVVVTMDSDANFSMQHSNWVQENCVHLALGSERSYLPPPPTGVAAAS